jgi:adenosylmethionine-8-amino-7-oxononanoate aminotransferase
MAGKQDVKDLIDRLLELIQKLMGSTCFTREELDDIVKKLQEVIDELQKIVG